MATDTAGKWIIGILIYYVVLFAIVTFISSFVSTYDVSDSSVTYSGGSAGISSVNFGGCEEPRSVYAYSKSCKKLMDIGSVYNNETCSQVSGCSWETETSWFGWGESTVTCTGTINTTAYNGGVSAGTTTFLTGLSTSICDLSNLSTDSHLCQFMGCSWNAQGTDDLLTFKGIGGVGTLIKDIVTLNIQFSSSSQTLNTMLNFIFIVLPLILLIIAGVIFLRG